MFSNTSSDSMKQHIAIVGAGLSGLTLAQTILPHFKVTIFEKNEIPGGRCTAFHAPPYNFDHGAQFFTVKHKEIKTLIQPLISSGIIAPWHGRFVELQKQHCQSSRMWSNEKPHYVGVPDMQAIAKHWADGLNIRYQTNITKVTQHNNHWMVLDQHRNHLGLYDWVILTLPVTEALPLLPNCFTYNNQLYNYKMKACYSLMLGYEPGFDLGFDAALIRDASISWISANHKKPGRSMPPAYLVHATNNWADLHLNLDNESVQTALLEETTDVFGKLIKEYTYINLHRWPFANINKQNTCAYFLDQKNQLGVCGDWLIQGRIEAAILSGIRIAKHLILSKNQ